MLDNKVAVVTGGASGLGLAIAEKLFEQNFKVIVFDINGTTFQNLSNKFDCYEVDVTNEQSVVVAVEKVIESHKKIDVLINNAGIIHSAPLINIMNPQQKRHSYSEFKKIIDIDLNAVFLVTSIIAEKMILKRTKGSIINISSISAKGKAGQSAYSASKAAVESMTKVWAKELGTFGIRANAIAPGFIDTPSTAQALNEKIIDDIKKNTPLRSLGKTENISQAIIHLIENDFINGSILAIDGGLVV